MKILIFNGEPGKVPGRASSEVMRFLEQEITAQGWEPMIFSIGQNAIPMFEGVMNPVPEKVQEMIEIMRSADMHIWLSPLYHGSITGMMKSALDWLEVSSQEHPSYLTGKMVGLMCWADGGMALHGIHTMTNIAHALRAWVLPYSIPAMYRHLLDEEGKLTDEYKMKLTMMLQLLAESNNKKN